MRLIRARDHVCVVTSATTAATLCAMMDFASGAGAMETARDAVGMLAVAYMVFRLWIAYAPLRAKVVDAFDWLVGGSVTQQERELYARIAALERRVHRGARRRKAGTTQPRGNDGDKRRARRKP